MRKKIFKTLCQSALVACCTMAAPAVMAQRITSNSQVIDCGQVLFRKPVTVHFELLNEGAGALNIKNVESSCGCTDVVYPKGAISENKPFVITATYDAKQLGHFEKYIDVYTSGASLPYILTLKGVVVDEVRDFKGDYPFMIGKLRADMRDIFFDDVHKGDMPSQEIHVLNPTSDNFTPVMLHLPDYLRADMSPSSIPPGKRGVIIITLDSRRIADYGLTQTSLYLGQSANDRVAPEKEMHVEAILIPQTVDLSDQRLAYMPKMRISSDVLDLGEFEGKKKKKGTLVIENLGRTDLEITSLQMFTDGLTVELTDNVIQPGSSAKLKVTADKKAMKGVKRQPRILMITNDPRNPKVVVDVNIK